MSDLRGMVDLRHEAEQRGHFEPLGRLLAIETAHGMIEFGTGQGEGLGPDLAEMLTVLKNDPDAYLYKDMPNVEALEYDPRNPKLIVLGPWLGLPSLRKNSTAPCPKCKRVCEVCDGTGKKLCEICGGLGHTPGNWISCPGPGCHRDTGHYKDDCATCKLSEVRGQLREQNMCLMCCGVKRADGFTVMKCSACRGAGKRSTGIVGGSLDWQLPKCKACAGTGWKGTFAPQDVKKFTNAQLDPLQWPDEKTWPKQTMLALGPIHSFTIKDFMQNRIRTFGVSQDSQGDYLMLLVPKVPRAHSKAYLVGGVVRERIG